MKKFVLSIIFIFIVTNLFGGGLKYAPLKRMNARFYSMGGAYTALVNNKLMAYYNPAGYAFNYTVTRHYRAELYDDFAEIRQNKKNKRLSIFNFDFEISEDFFMDSMLEYVSQNDIAAFITSFDGDKLADFLGYDELITNADQNNYSYFVDFVNTNMIASTKVGLEIFNYATKNFGTAMDFLADVNIKILNSYTLPPLNWPQININMDLITYFSFGFKLKKPKNMALGFTTKIFSRVVIDATTVNQTVELYKMVDKYTSDSNSIADSLVSAVNHDFFRFVTGNVDDFGYGDFLYAGTGFGLDLGWMYHPTSKIYFGLMFNNILTGIKWYGGKFKFFPVAIDSGVSYQSSIDLFGLFSRPLFSLGFSDVFNVYNDPAFKRFNFGMEFNILYDFLTLRFGLYQGFASYSVHKDINLLNLRKIPFVKLFFPRKLSKPLSIFQLIVNKRFNYEGLLDYYRRNIIVSSLSRVFRILSVMNYSIDAGVYGQEYGKYLGSLSRYSLVFNFSTDLVF